MMGFAKIEATAPSGARAMAAHLMNATLRPEDNRLAAYYATGVVQPEVEQGPTKRDRQNEEHFEKWLGGEVKPNLVRLAEYALTDEARISPGEIQARLASELERAIAALDGGGLSTEARALHGLPEPLTRDAPEYRLKQLPDLWVEALDAANERAEQRWQPDANAPIAVVRPDLHPLAAIGLGINASRKLNQDQVEALLAGRRSNGDLIEGKHYAKRRALPVNPKTGERREAVPIGSYDFSTSTDKSVSVAWALANPLEKAKIFNAHVEASRESVAYMADRIGVARIGDGGRLGSEKGHVGWLEFTHHTSRRTQFDVVDGEVVARTDKGAPGDPELHTHHLIPNAVFTESGRVGSLDTAGVPGFLKEAGAVYQMRLAQHLRDADFQVELDPKTGAAVMPIIPDDIRTLFSKRSMIGELMARKYTADRGEDWEKLSDDQRAGRLKTATQDMDQKVKGGKDDVANYEDWARQAKEFGWEAPESFRQKVYTVEMSPGMKRDLAYEMSLPVIDERLQHKSVLQHFDLRIAAAHGMIALGGGDLADIDAITAHMRERGVQQYGGKTPLVWGIEESARYTSVTTALHKADEEEFVRLAKTAGADKSGAIPTGLLQKHIRLSGLDFSEEHGRAQRAVIERLGTGGRFGVALGAAGSGKTTLLKPLVAAWHEQGRAVISASLAWRQADDLLRAGVDRSLAFSVLIDAIKSGHETVDRNTVVAVDELGLLGTRQGLELLRLQEKHGFSVVAIGDDKQAEAPSAGAIIDLARRALGAEQIPEIMTTRRQQTEREQKIAGLFREGRAAEALEMKRSDGTAEMAFGGYEGVLRRIAAIYAERLQETGTAPSISVPTNQDAHRVSEAVRAGRREMGLLGSDLMTLSATDGERNYRMPIAKGDRVRLFRSTRAVGRGGTIGRNGSVLEVVDANPQGLVLRAKSGKVGPVRWKTLDMNGRVLLAYGDAMTIHTAQGSTSKEHISAFPAGSQAVDGKLGYSGSTRHELRSWLVTNDAAERESVRRSRALNDSREITLDDKWANVARVLAWQPEKDTAIAMLERISAPKWGRVIETAGVDVRQARQSRQAADVVENLRNHRTAEELLRSAAWSRRADRREVGRGA